MKKRAYIYETISAFILIDCLNFIFFWQDPGFLTLSLHPYWIIVLLIASRYGFSGGLFSGFCAGAQALFFMCQDVSSLSGIERVIESKGVILPVSFLFIGIVLGGIRQKYIHKYETVENELDDVSKSLESINKRFETEEKARKVLEARIIGETATVKTLYGSSKHFESLDIDNIFIGCLDVMQDGFHVEKASFYLLEEDYFVLKASKGWENEELVEGKISKDKCIMNLAVDEDRYITIKDILNRRDSNQFIDQYGQVLAMFPVRNSRGKGVGVVNIEKMDFLHYNTPNLNMIELIVEWAGRALYNRLFLNSLESRMINDDNLGIFEFNHFQNVSRSEFIRAKQFKLDLTVFFIKIDRYGFLNEKTQELVAKSLVSLLKKYLHETDMLFKYRFDGIFCVLSPMFKKDSLKSVIRKVESEFYRVISNSHSDEKHIKLVSGGQEYTNCMTDIKVFLTPALKECNIPMIGF